MIWHVLFASNFLFFVRGEFSSTLSYFWSHAVGAMPSSSNCI